MNIFKGLVNYVRARRIAEALLKAKDEEKYVFIKLRNGEKIDGLVHSVTNSITTRGAVVLRDDQWLDHSAELEEVCDVLYTE